MAQKKKAGNAKPRSFSDLHAYDEDRPYRAPAPVQSQSAVQKAPPKKRKKSSRQGPDRRKGFLVLGLMAVLLVVLLVNGLTRKNGITVALGEETVGVIKKQSVTAEDIEKTVVALLESEMGTEIKLVDAIVLTPVHAKKDDLVTLDSVISKIKNTAPYQVKAAAVQADGATIGVLVNQEEAEALLQSIIDEYVPEGTTLVSSGFQQDVQVVEQFVDVSEIITADEARAKFTAGTETQKSYTVVTGDSLYKIALNMDMTLEELMAANPGVTPEDLKIGQQLTVTVNTPFLSVKTVENQTFIEKQPKETEYRTDTSLGKGVSKVIQQGRDGQREVVTQIIRINGFIEEEKEMSANIIQEPVKEIIAVGP